MALRRLFALLGAILTAACYTPPDAPPTVRAGALAPTSLTFQAVDAGTGSALEDDEMVVRYLVRAPIVFDASSVERVPSIEPYEIEHAVSDPELVLEVRVEADSYHRLDTVLSVPKGTSAGPLTVRLSRRLDRVAQTTAPAPRPRRRHRRPGLRPRARTARHWLPGTPHTIGRTGSRRLRRISACPHLATT